MYLFANATIYIGLAMAVYSLLIMTLGISTKNQKFINSGKGGIISVFICAGLAMLALFYLLGSSNFNYEYVVDYTSSELPIVYKLTALWAGNAGSLLLWTFFLTLYMIMITFSRKMKGNPMVPYIMSILLANTVFFFLILGFVAKPFALMDIVPAEGKGLNPMLQNPGMIIHPVTLYLGYVGLAVPFAFSIAALIMKNVDDFWIKMTRRWTIIAWLFLSLGNIFGGQWAYVELGWGGYWAWDPVENASFMPWLTATAFLHSVMIQERKNMLKVWNISLIIISYALTLFGTFLVRSGVLTSVHAFSNSNLGLYFLVFMGVAVIGSLYVLMSRYNLLKRSAGEFNSFISKESSFLVNNLLLLGAAFAVFWGTIFPLVSEAVRGTKVTVGIPFFNTVEAPILLCMMFVMAVCPMLAWQKSSVKNLKKNFLIPASLAVIGMILMVILGIQKAWAVIGYGVIILLLVTHFLEFYRGVKARRKMTGENPFVALYRLMVKNRRRYGGYLVHLGIACITMGIIGSQNYDLQTMKTIALGKSIEIKDYRINYERLDQKKEGVNDVVFADVEVFKDGKKLGSFEPKKVFYANTESQPSSEVAIISSLKEDLYIVLSAWENDGKATFLVKVNPMMDWLWIGSFMIVLGALFAVWNGKYHNITPRYTGVRKEVA
ncbi:heme lyase CcmF/NrfE family subunit [Neobacillus sp. PS3-40]|jgi:cytochrome c-type biogenesis protein CcmF|uniref:heme lyase CcmF/NrfE family subunit n=1 Tax=Neobacillus sp. PS3-40 TaxID=3070679 RepID=UPI0027E1E648|nr:heme lyase CcmF/NrfE family subunit [Neobacillus sp. PS3-40]WML45266.1 heme lyase CcmF/NrfE family subunit [Neobacillus sp. PS3-40]